MKMHPVLLRNVERLGIWAYELCGVQRDDRKFVVELAQLDELCGMSVALILLTVAAFEAYGTSADAIWRQCEEK